MANASVPVRGKAWLAQAALQDPSRGMQNSQVKTGAVYQAVDHGRRLRVRVLSRSEKYPGTWVCEDLDRGETRHLPAKQLEALRESGS